MCVLWVILIFELIYTVNLYLLQYTWILFVFYCFEYEVDWFLVLVFECKSMQVDGDSSPIHLFLSSVVWTLLAAMLIQTLDAWKQITQKQQP